MPVRAVTLDAVGTVLEPARPVASTYAEVAARHGVSVGEREVSLRFPIAFRAHRDLRARDPHWKAYWEAVISECVGHGSPAILRTLYDYYARGEAWRVVPEARHALTQLREAGVRTALVSNFDVRLRPLLRELDLDAAFDVVVVSGEEGVEKPDPRIFLRAVKRLGVAAHETVHVGDDPDADARGAEAAGLQALLVDAPAAVWTDLLARARPAGSARA